VNFGAVSGCSNEVDVTVPRRAVATGVGRRVERSRQAFGGRGKRAKRRGMEGRHRPDAANHGGWPYHWIATTLKRGHPAAVRGDLSPRTLQSAD